ncbi:MAG: response regulator transcription factor [Bacteroidales bacterium]|jgi:DNA-binding response OmpR family regulator|nr:response regulator transcription factor [Bacteroidales bacterium]
MDQKKGLKIQVLLVEDDANLCMVLQDYLEFMAYNVIVAHDGEAGLARFDEHEVHLCILDVMLPRMDGFALAAAIRDRNKQIPIIFLTAKSLKEDRLKGFAQGCDDYITKPFSTEELNLRIKAIMRRCNRNMFQEEINEQKIFVMGNYRLDTQNLTLTIAGSTSNLTKKEATLLRLLYLHKNTVLARDFVQKTIWGETDYFVSRSMDVFITRLRKYLKEDSSVNIVNVHGVGFMLEVPKPAGE